LLGCALQGCGGSDDSGDAAGTATGRPDGTPPAADGGTPAAGNGGTPAAADPDTSAGAAIGDADDPANRAPTIAGTPPPSVLQGASYAFEPAAADADGNTLTFDIVNRPAWATFDTETGSLQGTPGPQDVGMFADIAISVSDGVVTTELPAFDIAVLAVASGSARLTWTPPTLNDNGSPLTNLAGYKVYWGTTPDNYPSSATVMNPGVSTYVVENLSPNTYHFVVTAINSAGLESDYSSPWQKTIQ
jgi:hypothetical protein